MIDMIIERDYEDKEVNPMNKKNYWGILKR